MLVLGFADLVSGRFCGVGWLATGSCGGLVVIAAVGSGGFACICLLLLNGLFVLVGMLGVGAFGVYSLRVWLVCFDWWWV